MIELLVFVPFLVQGCAMMFDEFYFHRRRGLPRWERWGHPLDTASVLVCYGIAIFFPFSRNTLVAFVLAATFSTLFVTKDEFIHAKVCQPAEHWLHAILFVTHPILLAVIAILWAAGDGGGGNWLSLDSPFFYPLFLRGQAMVTLLFLGYQVVYWNWMWKEPRHENLS